MIVTAIRRGRHDVVPPGPVDYVRVSLDLGDRWGSIHPIIILSLPTGHASVDAIGIQPRVLQISNIETDIAFRGANVAGAQPPWCPGDSNGGGGRLYYRRGNQEYGNEKHCHRHREDTLHLGHLNCSPFKCMSSSC